MIYADYNATAPLRPEAREALLAALALGATNPSSVHSAGRAARRLAEQARSDLGAALSTRADDITFTSGGTESANLAVHGLVAGIETPVTFLVSAIEHEAISRAAAFSGARIETAYIDTHGQLNLPLLAARLAVWDHAINGTPVLCLMLANNETGVLQPVAEAATMVRNAGGLTICDAVQGLGKVSVNVAMLGVDYLIVSAHKIGGPQGAGALWHRAGAPLKTILHGGGQERGLRSGTENVAAIAGFGAACVASIRDLPHYQALGPLRDAMEARLVAEGGVTITAKASARLAGVSNFARPGFRAETQVMALDLGGVCASAGSACSSGKVKRSLVLGAMGASDAIAESAIRLSFGWASTPVDFDAAADVWLAAARRASIAPTG